MDTESSARGPGTKGLRYAASKGLAVVVMEPIQGGRLAITPPPEVQAIWDEAEVKRTPAEWALQWVWNQPEVSLVLSGMSTMQHVIENVERRELRGALPPAAADKEPAQGRGQVVRERQMRTPSTFDKNLLNLETSSHEM